MGFVLDILGQDIEAVDLRGEPRGDRGAAFVAALGDDARRAGGIARHDRPDAELADDAAALPERMDVALDGLDVGKFRAARRHQLMMDRQEPFADDEQAGLRQQMMDVGDAAGDRIFDRDHAEVGFPRGDRGECVLEGRAGQRLGVGIGLGDGDMGIRARFALECNFHGLGRCFGHGALYQPLSFSPVDGGRLEVGRRIDAARHRVHQSDVDPHAGLDRPKLLQFLLSLERRGGSPTKRCSAARR